MNVGITIGGNNFNAICYADDILLCSTTITGLQFLIDEANEYIQNHGLKFNPQKTECMMCGPNPFSCDPKWTIGSVPLNVVPSVKYLGTNLHSASHVETRKNAAQRAFYSLQGAGVKYGGVSPVTALDIYRTAVASFLSCGCSSVHLSHTELKELDKVQSKHIKCIMGLKYSSHTTALLNGLAVMPTSTVIQLDACLASNSSSNNFYVQMLKRQYEVNIGKTLVGRVNSFLSTTNVNFNYCLLNNTHLLKKTVMKYNISNGLNGTVEDVNSKDVNS